MRYIDLSDIVVPLNWLDLAKIEYGTSYAHLWSFFRPNFESLYGKKCWYSENENAGAKNSIDHFRPKANNVKALPPQFEAIFGSSIWNQLDISSRDGYKFLTYEFINYRYSCDLVNSPNKKETKDKLARGKWDYFPLQKHSASATSLQVINSETHCLLDPCNSTDPTYLSFDEKGEIQPHKSLLSESWEYCRVKVSVELYHLHYYRFIDSRKEVWDTCCSHVELADGLFNKRDKTEYEVKNLAFHVKELQKKIIKKAPFSAVAIDCLKRCKENIEWLDNFFPDDSLIK